MLHQGDRGLIVISVVSIVEFGNKHNLKFTIVHSVDDILHHTRIGYKQIFRHLHKD